MNYISNIGGCPPTDFETAILDGFASSGGLYVPEELPKITKVQLQKWKNLGYVDLAFEILSLFIDRSIISEKELKHLLQNAYAPFEKEEIIPIHKLKSRKDTYILELFHGPTISFKDVGLAFLVNLVNFFLERKKAYQTLVVATTGDTGPAAAYFAAGKSCLDLWVLYPKDMITESQARQMTTLPHHNIHPVGVSNCPNGADDLDMVISKLFAYTSFKEKLNLSSVNSINWGRVMMQTVHYFYAYLNVASSIDEQVNISVPSGAFGNLCAGAIARQMGLPVQNFIVANNKNECLHRLFSRGIFSISPIHETVSSAIDILIPYNFWRYLHFATGGKIPEKIKFWMEEFKLTGMVRFDKPTFEAYRKGFVSVGVSDKETLNTMKETFVKEHYLFDPHGAVAVAAADLVKSKLGDEKLICFATAHPAKFPNTVLKALEKEKLPEAGKHNSIEKAKKQIEKVYLCDHSNLEEFITSKMEKHWTISKP